MLYEHKTRLIDEADQIRRKIPKHFLKDLRAYRYGQNAIDTCFCMHISEEDGTLSCNTNGVEMQFIGTKWSVGPHTDPMFPRWSHFLVLQNEGFKLESIDTFDTSKPYRAQIPGAIMSLNIHKLHWLDTVGHEIKSPYWIALTFSSDKKLSEEIVVRRFRAAAAEIG